MTEPVTQLSSRIEALGEGLYSIGDLNARQSHSSNTYLILGPSGKAAIIDPGPSDSFRAVLENLLTITTLEQVKFIILQHADPDICSSLPLFEQAGLRAQIVTSDSCINLIRVYGIRSPFRLIDQNDRSLLVGGRTLEFIPTPYLHFPGAFATFDQQTSTLFSSDLFSASPSDALTPLFADDGYLPMMLEYHRQVMPSNTVLRPVMDLFSLYDIKRIAPHHGAILSENIPMYIEALRTLECGALLAPLKKDLMRSGGTLMVFNEVQHHLFSLRPYQEVADLFQKMPFLEVNDHNEIKGYSLKGIDLVAGSETPDLIGITVWNALFKFIQSEKGMAWLTSMEPFVRKLCNLYDLPLPDAFHSTLSEMASENQKLHEVNTTLDQTIQQVNDRLLKDPITGLYNENFLRSLLLEELASEDWRDLGHLVTIGIDDFADYQGKMGVQQGNNVLNNMAYMLKEEFGQNTTYRLTLAAFGLYIKGLEPAELISKMETFRSAVAKSDLFLGRLTISAGIVFAKEIALDAATLDATMGGYFELALKRLRHARVTGKNRLCHKGDDPRPNTSPGKVLLVDSDSTNIALLKNFLNEDGIEVLTAGNGVQARDLAFSQLPTVIVTEVILSQMDGFSLREELLRNSDTKDIETVFLSFKKDDESVKRAISLGVTHFIRKPYLLSELLGIIKRNLQGSNL